MGARHSKQWWAGRAAEAAFAGGSSADTAFAQTKLATLASMPYPRSYGFSMYPFQKPTKEEIESQDDEEMGSQIADAGWEIGDGDREDYVQDKFYWTHVLAVIAAGQAAVPSTYALHWQDHLKDATPTPANDDLRYESFGAYVKELSFVIPKNTGKKDGFPYWKVKDTCYSTKTEDAAGTDVDSITKQAWLAIASYPIVTKASYTIGGQAVKNLEGTFKVIMTYDEDREAGDDGLKYPYFLKAAVEFTVKCKDYDQYKTLIQNVLMLATAESKYTVKVNTGLTSVFLQCTNMRIDEGDLGGIPAPGIASYDLVLKSTSASVLSEESS